MQITNEDKLFFPARGLTKGDLVRYYLAVANHALPHLRRRLFHMVRYPHGVGGEFFHQKRVPAKHPPYGIRRNATPGPRPPSWPSVRNSDTPAPSASAASPRSPYRLHHRETTPSAPRTNRDSADHATAHDDPTLTWQ